MTDTMHATPHESATLDAQRNNMLRTASQAMARVRRHHGKDRMHRGMACLSIRPRLLIEALLLPLASCWLLWRGKSTLLTWWRDCIEFWMDRLGLPIQAALQSGAGGNLLFRGLYLEEGSTLPSVDLQIGIATAIFALMVISFRLSDRQLPLAYFLRVVCGLQALALVFFQIMPARFPYTVTEHLAHLVNMAYPFILLTPVMLSLGFHILNVSLLTKLMVSGAIVGYFIIMIPHQVILHALILHYGSVVFMPALYLCGGIIFDMLIFIALYAWALSRLPPGRMHQTTDHGPA